MTIPVRMSKEIHAKLNDPEYAKGFGEEYAKTVIGLLLAKTLAARQMSQSELAKCLGVNQSYIAKLESGEANPTVGKIWQIMGMLGYRLIVNAEDWVATDEVGRSISVAHA